MSRNYLNEILKNIFYLIGMILLALIPILIYFAPILFPINLLMILIIAIITSIISIVPTIFLFESIITYFKLKKKLNLNLKSYRNYKEFIAFTNKRWIQKSLSYEKYQYSEYSSPKINFEKDIASVNLEDIKVIYIIPLRKSIKLCVMFFVDWEEDIPYKNVFWVEVGPSELNKLESNFRSVFTFTTEKVNEYREGDLILYRQDMGKK